MARVFKSVRQAIRLAEFVGKSMRFLWMQFIALSLLAVAQQLFYSLGNVLLFASFALLALMGFDAVAKAGGGTMSAVVIGAILAPLAQLAGFVASALLGTTPDAQAIVLALAASALVGGVFAGVGAVVARVQSLHWLKK